MKTLKNLVQPLLRIAVACSAIALFVAHTTLHAQSIEERLQKEIEEFDAVGLAVAVVKDNEIIYTNQFGWKDLEAKIPLEKGDVFRIASISKSFSAIAIMQLIEQGKLSLDDDVSDLVGFPIRNPKFPDKPITLEMLLTHTSSLTDKQRYYSLDIINPKTNDDWVKSYANYAPGTKYQYCNLGFNTIGAIIEAASGQRFDLYIKEHILDPLGLYGGYLPDELDASRFAQLYRYNRKAGKYKKSTQAYRLLNDRLKDYKLGYDGARLSPTGGMKISVTDLAKYMMLHMNYGRLGDVQILSEKSAKEMQTPHAKIDAKTSYGYALRIYNGGGMIPGVDLVGHTGSASGLNSAIMFDPEKKFGLVAISSGFLPGDPSFRTHVLGILYDHFIEKTPVEIPAKEEVNVNKISLVLGAQGSQATHGGFADLKKGRVMSLKEASANQKDVDLVYTWGKSTKADLMLPISTGLNFFGKKLREQVYEGWSHKNWGKLIALEGNKENRQLYKDIKTNKQLKAAYEKALTAVKQREDYYRADHGPNARLNKLKEGDIVFVLINSREKGILSLIGSEEQEILAVGEITSITEGFNGEIAIDFKIAITP
ncbi:serine hydrolase domain-containing protein [Sinomicrobium sp.]